MTAPTTAYCAHRGCVSILIYDPVYPLDPHWKWTLTGDVKPLCPRHVGDRYTVDEWSP